MVGETVRTTHVNAHVLPRPERVVAHGIAHTVVPLHTFLSGIVIVGIRKIILPVVFVHPCSLVEIHQPLHGLHRAVYLHHVVLQPAALARAAPALV